LVGESIRVSFPASPLLRFYRPRSPEESVGAPSGQVTLVRSYTNWVPMDVVELARWL